MKRHLALFLGDLHHGNATASTLEFGTPVVPDGAYVWDSGSTSFVPVTATMDEAGTGPDLTFGVSVYRASALHCSSAVKGDTWHAVKITAALAVPNAGAASAGARFSPGAGTAYETMVTQVTAAVTALRALGGDVVFDRVYWASIATALSTRADDTHLIEYSADMRLLMRRIGDLLGTGDVRLPVSTLVFQESAPGASTSFDSLEMNARTAELMDLYEHAGVTDARDYKRADDVSFTGDSTLELGKAMAHVPSLRTAPATVTLGL